MRNISRKFTCPMLVLSALIMGCKPSTQDSGAHHPGDGHNHNPSQDKALQVHAAAPVEPKASPEFEALKVKAESGDAAAQFQIGKSYFKGVGVAANDSLAHEWCLKAAQQDHSDAQTYLGYLYINGRGVPQDFTEALRWYTKAAQQNNPSAQYNLGVMYDNGQGIPEDFGEAFQWFANAAEQNFARAQYSLGAMYENGRGVPQDYVQAISWYHKAAANGDAASVASVEALLNKLTPEQVAAAAKAGL